MLELTYSENNDKYLKQKKKPSLPPFHNLYSVSESLKCSYEIINKLLKMDTQKRE